MTQVSREDIEAGTKTRIFPRWQARTLNMPCVALSSWIPTNEVLLYYVSHVWAGKNSQKSTKQVRTKSNQKKKINSSKHGPPVHALAVSHDGKYVAMGGKE